ncbi:MAG: hypothetical protein ACJAW4_001056 [Paracoccaceae bacterium]|jgi:hypothetical protein
MQAFRLRDCGLIAVPKPDIMQIITRCVEKR